MLAKVGKVVRIPRCLLPQYVIVANVGIFRRWRLRRRRRRGCRWCSRIRMRIEWSTRTRRACILVGEVLKVIRGSRRRNRKQFECRLRSIVINSLLCLIIIRSLCRCRRCCSGKVFVSLFRCGT